MSTDDRDFWGYLPQRLATLPATEPDMLPPPSWDWARLPVRTRYPGPVLVDPTPAPPSADQEREKGGVQALPSESLAMPADDGADQ